MQTKLTQITVNYFVRGEYIHHSEFCAHLYIAQCIFYEEFNFTCFAVTTEESVEQTTPTNVPSVPSLPETTTMTTDGETPPPTTPPPIQLVTLRGPRTGDPVMFANGYVLLVSSYIVLFRA